MENSTKQEYIPVTIDSGEKLPFVKFPQFLLALDISLSAKLVYALLLDRAELSKKNGWTGEQGRVYVVYPIKELAVSIGYSERAAITALNELDKEGLIERHRSGFSAAKQIFINQPLVQKLHLCGANSALMRGKNCTYEVQKLHPIKTNNTQTKLNKTKVDIFSDFAKGDVELLTALREYEAMRTKIKKPMTDRAREILCNKLEKEIPPGDWVAVLDDGILHCWLEVYPLKKKQATQPAGQEVLSWG